MPVAQIGNNPVQPYPAQPRETQPASGDNSAVDTSTGSIGSTFLTLLVQELQNQDPTAPMDSTQMVGQMISLNQLDQLTSINQVLSDTFGSSAPTSSGSATPNIAAASQSASPEAVAKAALNSAAAMGGTGQSAL